MKTFLYRLLKRENYVALLLIAASLVSVFEIPQRFGVSETKLILILIGFLAIDTLIEKTGYLDELEVRVKRIDHLIAPSPNTVQLGGRESLASFSGRIKEAKQVFVSAISANSFVTQNYRTIQTALKNGTSFRFVLVSPDSPVLQAVTLTSPTSTGVERQSGWINDTIDMLKKLAQVKAEGKIELRLCQGVPTVSIVARDIDRSDAWIQVELHTFRQDPASRPLFVLRSEQQSEWFDFYKRMTVELWNDSQPLDS